MFRIFIVLVLIIGASSGVLFTNTYLAFQQSKTNLIERDRVVLRDIRNQLIQAIIRDESSGLLMLPLGENTENNHLLPEWLFVPRVNPFGNSYIYCPYGEISGSYNGLVNINSGNSYQIGIIENEQTNNNNYVLYSSERIARNVLGVIISNHESQNRVDCSDIDSPNNVYFGNSLVEIIYKDSILYNDLLQERYFNISNEEDMNQALSLSSNSINNRTVFNLSEDVAMVGVSFNNNSGENRVLRFTSQNNNRLSSLSASPVDLEFNNMDVYFENIRIANNIRIVANNSNIYFRDSSVAQFKLLNSKMEKTRSEITVQGNSGNNSIESYNSKISIYDSGNINIINNPFLMHSTSLSIIDSNLNINIINENNEMYGFSLISGSNLYSESSNITFNNNHNIDRVFDYDLNSNIDISNSTFSNANVLFSGSGGLSSRTSIYNNIGSVFEGIFGSRINLTGNIMNNVNYGITDAGINLLTGFNNQINYLDGCILGLLGEGIIIEEDLVYESIPSGNYPSEFNVILNRVEEKAKLEIDLTDLYKNFSVEDNCVNKINDK